MSTQDMFSIVAILYCVTNRRRHVCCVRNFSRAGSKCVGNDSVGSSCAFGSVAASGPLFCIQSG